MDNVNLLVAENLKNIRLKKGWSQAFVANQLGIAQRTISRAECGCSVSRRTLQMISGMYQIPIASLYEECVQEHSKEIHVVPDDVAVGLLIRNSFIQDLEQEIILRYTDTIQREVVMLRNDVERILPEVLSNKKAYTMQEVVSACMMVNQKTIAAIKKIAVS